MGSHPNCRNSPDLGLAQASTAPGPGTQTPWMSWTLRGWEKMGQGMGGSLPVRSWVPQGTESGGQDGKRRIETSRPKTWLGLTSNFSALVSASHVLGLSILS